MSDKAFELGKVIAMEIADAIERGVKSAGDISNDDKCNAISLGLINNLGVHIAHHRPAEKQESYIDNIVVPALKKGFKRYNEFNLTED